MLFRSFIALFVTWCTVSVAQEAPPASSPISAQVLSNRVALGEYGTLIFKFTGGDVNMPDVIPAEGLEIVHSKKHSNFSNTPGGSSFVTTHFYRISGSELGTFSIPSVSVPFRDQTFSTDPIQITIHERDDSDAANATRPQFAKLELEKSTFYVNEIVPFTLSGFVRGRNAINEIIRAQLENESFIFKGFRNTRTDAIELGNNLYTSVELPSTFFALKPGEYRLGPAKMGARIVEPGAGLGFARFFNSSVVEMVSNSVPTTVKPLPEGAPASFTGGVGNFSLKGMASTAELGVGDPISMDFEVTGVGNLKTMGAPVMRSAAGSWRSYESNKTLNDENDSDGVNPGTALFSQVIIPEEVVSEIPPFDLTYFDPENERYVTLSTEAIPISVSNDGTAIQQVPLSLSDNSEESGAQAAARPSPLYEDLLYIRVDQPNWIAQFKPESSGILFMIVQIVLSIGLTTIVGYGLVRFLKNRQHRQTNLEPPTTFQQSIKRLPKAGSPKRDFYRAVTTALMLWRDENSDAPDTVSGIVQKLSDRCDDFLYSGNATTDPPIDSAEANELKSVLRRLQRS